MPTLVFSRPEANPALHLGRNVPPADAQAGGERGRQRQRDDADAQAKRLLGREEQHHETERHPNTGAGQHRTDCAPGHVVPRGPARG